MDVSDLIALKISEIIKEKHFNVYDIQDKTGIYNTTLYMFLHRETKTLRIENLLLICQALDLTIGEFFSDNRFDTATISEWRKEK